MKDRSKNTGQGTPLEQVLALPHEGTIGELLHAAGLLGAKEFRVDLRYGVCKLRIQKKRINVLLTPRRFCKAVITLLQCHLLGLGSPVVFRPEDAGPLTSLLYFTVEVKLFHKVFGVPFWA